MRSVVAPVVSFVACAALGCSDSTGAGGAFSARFLLRRGNQTVDCKTVSQIANVEVVALYEASEAVVAGWPKSADCATGEFTDATLVPGRYILSVTARGTLAGEADVTMFRGKSNFVVPNADPVEVVLAPEVAFATIQWGFGALENLGPCTDEDIGRVDVYVSTGASGSGSHRARGLGCRAVPHAFSTPFLPQNYTIRVEAYSRTTQRNLYASEARHTLERGENPTLQAILTPIGGHLIFDWAFKKGPSPARRECDHPEVNAPTLALRVANVQGGDPLSLSLDCGAAARPHTILGARFAERQPLTVDLIAEGTERYRGQRTLTMPQGDADLGEITLVAVGTATVTFDLGAQSACRAGVDRFEVSLLDSVTSEVRFEAEVAANARKLALDDIPFGTYNVRVRGLRQSSEICSTSDPRSIAARENTWDPFIL